MQTVRGLTNGTPYRASPPSVHSVTVTPPWTSTAIQRLLGRVYNVADQTVSVRTVFDGAVFRLFDGRCVALR